MPRATTAAATTNTATIGTTGATSCPTASALAPTSHDRLAIGIGVAWIVGILTIDQQVNIWGQYALGLLTWTLLAYFLRKECRAARWQVAVVVAYASIIEYVFAGGLHVYTYRLHNVPLFVPPGHGLVYLAALSIARLPALNRHRRAALTAMLLADGLWALWGVTLSPRSDWLGVFWFGCLLVWVRFGKAPLVYVGAFLVVSYLEILGTSLGTWAWGTHDPTGIITIGNPPSGIAGGYCWFDAAALFFAPLIIRGLDRRSGSGAATDQPQRRVVEQPVTAQDAAAPAAALP